MSETAQTNRRQFQRYRVPPMYSAVTVRRIEPREAGYGVARLDGHAYDISFSGVRVELDEPLAAGEAVTVYLALPGEAHEVHASARVIWVNDADDDPGPRRMALLFTDFLSDEDRDRLRRYLRSGVRRIAA